MPGRIKPFKDSITLGRIVFDQFVAVADDQKRVRWRRVFFFVVVPLFASLAIVSAAGPLAIDAVEWMFVVFSIVAAVMTSMIAVVHSVAAGTILDREYDKASFIQHDSIKARLLILADLYTSIAFTVLILIVATFTLAGFVFPLYPAIKWALSLFAVWVAFAAGLCFLDILAGVYTVLRHHVSEYYSEVCKRTKKAGASTGLSDKPNGRGKPE